jgi:hypothetical protein
MMKKFNLFPLLFNKSKILLPFTGRRFATLLDDDDPGKYEIRFKDKQDRNPIDELKKKERGKIFVILILHYNKQRSKKIF